MKKIISSKGGQNEKDSLAFLFLLSYEEDYIFKRRAK
jgi:hypothetical protein